MKKFSLIFTFFLLMTAAGCHHEGNNEAETPQEKEDVQEKDVQEKRERNEEIPSQEETSEVLPEGEITELPELPQGSFHYEEEMFVYYGDFYVEGYAETVMRDEAWCEEDCQTFEYVLFHILDSNNAALDEFLEMNSGNAYAGDTVIGLGCLEGNSISYFNDSDETGMTEYEIDPATTDSILTSQSEYPVRLHIERKLFTGGSGAPTCYSHFYNVELFKS